MDVHVPPSRDFFPRQLVHFGTWRLAFKDLKHAYLRAFTVLTIEGQLDDVTCKICIPDDCKNDTDNKKRRRQDSNLCPETGTDF